jgi:hypothetical protein
VKTFVVKSLVIAALLAGNLLAAENPAVPCAELAQKTESTFRKMDQALKVKAGMLLGEMEAAKGALQGCLDRNEAVSAQMALVWLLGDVGLVAVLPLLFFHQRRMRRAVKLLAGLYQAKEPAHAVRYEPSSGLYLTGMALLVIGLLGLNFVALLL